MYPNKSNSRRGKGLISLLAVLLIFGVIIAGCGKKDEADASGALLTYKDGGKVTKAEFDKFLNITLFLNSSYEMFREDAAFKRSVMDQYVTMKIWSEKATDEQKQEAEKATLEQMSQFQGALELQGGADAVLGQAGLVLDDFEQYLKQTYQAVYAAESKVTDDQLQTEYKSKLEQNPNAYDYATVSHILVQTMNAQTGEEVRTKDEALAIAKEVKAKLDAGGDFAALAKEYSDDPGSKETGGTYENYSVNDWVEGFKEQTISLPLNKISDPVETVYGYHIMKVSSRTTKSFDDVKADLKSELSQGVLYKFVTEELPGLIETNNLPEPEPMEEQPGGNLQLPVEGAEQAPAEGSAEQAPAAQ